MGTEKIKNINNPRSIFRNFKQFCDVLIFDKSKSLQNGVVAHPEKLKKL